MPRQNELTEEQIEKITELGDGAIDNLTKEIALEYINNTGDDDLSDIEEAYAGQFNSDEDFAREMADSLGDYNPRELHWPLTCIDWEYAAREIMYDYYSIKGFYFRNM